MANYFPQADPDGNCCDCPDRDSPCDPCGCIAPVPCCFHLDSVENADQFNCFSGDPTCGQEWRSLCETATLVPLADSGSGYYEWPFFSGIGTQHTRDPCGENPDFALSLKLRVYPDGDRWH